MPQFFDPNTGSIFTVPQDKDNEIIVKSADQMGGALNSGKQYFADGLVNVDDVVPILIPSTGLYLSGHGYGISGFFTTDPNTIMFRTPNAVHTLSSDRTGGTFTLTYDGQTTSALDWNDSAADVETALEALSNIGSGDVIVTGGDLPTDIVIEFTGALAETDVPLITVTDSGTGGTGVTVAETVIGYSGDLIVQNCYLYCTGANSKLGRVDNDGNNSAIEFNSVNLGDFANTTSELFEISNYRQYRTGDFAAINYTIGNTFNGEMQNFAINDSIALALVSGSTFLIEGTALNITGGFSSNMNFLSATGTTKFCDFQASNFDTGAVMALNNFRTNADDAVPNIDSKNIKASFKGCVGVANTFVGASWTVTTETATSITANKTLFKIAGTTTPSLDAHFSHPTNNRLQYNGEREIKVDVMAYIPISSNNTESFEIEARHRDVSASSWNNIRTVPLETALKILGDRRGSGTIIATAIMNTGDYIEGWILDASAAGTANPTAQLQGTLTIAERQS